MAGEPTMPFAVTEQEAARLCSVSRADFRELQSAGGTPAQIQIGFRVRWRVDDLKQWITLGCPSRERFEDLMEQRHRHLVRATPEPAPVNTPSLALRRREAAKALGLSERKLWEITADRTSGIPHARLGGVIIYPVAELERWLAELASRKAKR